jgi:hypothetical protein
MRGSLTAKHQLSQRYRQAPSPSTHGSGRVADQNDPLDAAQAIEKGGQLFSRKGGFTMTVLQAGNVLRPQMDMIA